jgi:hypothetical protein
VATAYALGLLLFSLAAAAAPSSEQNQSKRGQLGLELEDFTVVSVVPDSPAYRVGFAKGDVIVGVDYQDVTDVMKMVTLLHQPSTTGHLVRVRRGEGEFDLQLPPVESEPISPPQMETSPVTSASNLVVYLVVLKGGTIAQGTLVEYTPNDHVTLQLATGEVRHYLWSDISSARQIDSSTSGQVEQALANIAKLKAEMASTAPNTPTPSSTSSTSSASSTSSTSSTSTASTTTQADDHPHPKAGSWLVDFRVPMSITLSDVGPIIGAAGIEVGVGKRITDNVYVGGLLGADQEINPSSNGGFLFPLRAGAEAHYIFHEGGASMSTDGDEGPWVPIPRYDWIGLEVGTQLFGFEKKTGLQPPKGGFAQFDLGTDAWSGDSFHLGLVLSAGLSLEPHGIYGPPPDTSDAPGLPAKLPAPPDTSPTLSPYFSLAFHFELGG